MLTRAEVRNSDHIEFIQRIFNTEIIRIERQHFCSRLNEFDKRMNRFEHRRICMKHIAFHCFIER
jgi:hypothetical protein